MKNICFWKGTNSKNQQRSTPTMTLSISDSDSDSDSDSPILRFSDSPISDFRFPIPGRNWYNEWSDVYLAACAAADGDRWDWVEAAGRAAYFDDICVCSMCLWRCEWIAMITGSAASYVAVHWLDVQSFIIIAAHWPLADTDASSEVEVTLRYSYIAFGVV